MTTVVAVSGAKPGSRAVDVSPGRSAPLFDPAAGRAAGIVEPECA